MKTTRLFLLLTLGLASVQPLELPAQSTFIPPNLNNSAPLSSTVSTVREADRSADGTEITFSLEYAYDGLGSPTAQLLPILEKKGNKQVSGWFGADPVLLPQGKGLISLKVKFFNDEPGVPAEVTTDRIRFLFLNSGGKVVINSSTVLKTVKWGKAGSQPVKMTATLPLPSPEAAREKARVALEEETQAKEKARLAVQTEARARAEAEAREKARRQAEMEARRLAEQKNLVAAEELRRQEAQRKAEAEEKRLTEEKRLAEEKAKTEAALLQAAQAEAKAKEMARQTADENARAHEQPATPLVTHLKTKVTNVDVVNRSLDRSQMTIGVEFEYKDNLGTAPRMGIEVAKTDAPQTARLFDTHSLEIGRSKRSFLLFPVKFQPAASAQATLATDQVMVYIEDGSQKLPFYPATLPLMWRAPGSDASVTVSEASLHSLQLDDFRQKNPFSGYLTVKYNSPSGPGKVRVSLSDSARPGSGEVFAIDEVPVRPGSGLQLINIAVRPGAKNAKNEVITSDTVEIELLDASGKVTANLKRVSPMTWARP